MTDTIVTDAVAATAFRRLVAHLQHRTDVQNIDFLKIQTLGDIYRMVSELNVPKAAE